MTRAAFFLLLLVGACRRPAQPVAQPIGDLPAESAAPREPSKPSCPVELPRSPRAALEDSVLVRVPAGATVQGLGPAFASDPPQDCESPVVFGQLLEFEADPSRTPAGYLGEVRAALEAAGFAQVAESEVRVDSGMVFTVELTLEGADGEPLQGLASVRMGQGRVVGLVYALGLGASGELLGTLAASAESLVILPLDD